MLSRSFCNLTKTGLSRILTSVSNKNLVSISTTPTKHIPTSICKDRINIINSVCENNYQNLNQCFNDHNAFSEHLQTGIYLSIYKKNFSMFEFLFEKYNMKYYSDYKLRNSIMVAAIKNDNYDVVNYILEKYQFNYSDLSLFLRETTTISAHPTNIPKISKLLIEHGAYSYVYAYEKMDPNLHDTIEKWIGPNSYKDLDNDIIDGKLQIVRHILNQDIIIKNKKLKNPPDLGIELVKYYYCDAIRIGNLDMAEKIHSIYPYDFNVEIDNIIENDNCRIVDYFISRGCDPFLIFEMAIAKNKIAIISHLKDEIDLPEL